MNKSLELPWSMEDTIENMRNLRDILINQVSNANHEGKGNIDAEEIKFDFDRAISALEKQIPKKPEEKIFIRHDNFRDGTNIPRYDWWCSKCHLETIGTNLMLYCPSCGQAIDWEDKDE